MYKRVVVLSYVAGKLAVMKTASRLISDALWRALEPLLPPAKPRRARYPGRKPPERRAALEGILFVLRTGIGWNALPKALGFGCGSACHHRLVEWNDAGAWEKLHRALLKKLAEAKQIDWRRAVVDASSVRAVFGGTKLAPARQIAPNRAASTTC